MPTITATADNSKSQVRLDLDFSDIDAPYVYVQRVDNATGATTAVRGHGTSTTISGLPYVSLQAGYQAVLYDTEMPLDQACYYTATAPSVTMNANSTFTGGYADPWYTTQASPAAIARVNTTSGGSYYLGVSTQDGTSTQPTVNGEEIPATSGALFTLTAAVSANVSSSVTVTLSALNSAGAVLSTGTTTNAAVLAATTMTATLTCPANTVSVRPTVQVNTPASTSTLVSFSSIVVSNQAGSASSAAVTVQSLGSCFLKDPLRPGNNVRVDFAFDPNPKCTPTEGVFFQSMDTEQRTANSAAFNVNNQSRPVVVSKKRSSETSTLTLVSRTFPDRDRLNSILENGTPLLFQVPAQYGVKDRLMSVGTTSVSRVLPDHSFPIRVFSLPFSACASPGGSMQGTVGARWSDLCNKYATWTAINGAGLTWTQLLDGGAG